MLGQKFSDNCLMVGERPVRPRVPESSPRSRSLERLHLRLEKRTESLRRVKQGGIEIVIADLEVELDYLRRGTPYPEERASCMDCGVCILRR